LVRPKRKGGSQAGAGERKSDYFFLGCLEGWKVCRLASIPQDREKAHKEAMKIGEKPAYLAENGIGKRGIEGRNQACNLQCDADHLGG
jgi:hypothetical protein